MITVQKLNAFRKDMDAAMKAVAEKHGLDTDVAYKISYTANDFTVKSVKFVEKVDTAQSLFEEVCADYGFYPEDYGHIYQLVGRQFKLIGINPRASASPLLMEEVTTGRQYRVRAIAVPKSFDPRAAAVSRFTIRETEAPTRFASEPDGKGGMKVTPHWD